jgi:hypothetical protein
VSNTLRPRLTAARILRSLAGMIGLIDAAEDGGLQLCDRSEPPRLRRCRVSLAKKPSTALSQDADVGVK